jgi:hypothetical protein
MSTDIALMMLVAKTLVQLVQVAILQYLNFCFVH